MALPRAIRIVGWPKLFFFFLASKAECVVQAEQGLIDSAKAHVRLHMQSGAGLPSGGSHPLHLMKNLNLVKWASWPPTTVKSLTDCLTVSVSSPCRSVCIHAFGWLLG